MSNTRTVQRFTDKAVERANLIPKEEYKAIKHMNKIELAHYLSQVYARGYNEGYKDCTEKHKAEANSPAAATEE